MVKDASESKAETLVRQSALESNHIRSSVCLQVSARKNCLIRARPSGQLRYDYQ
jgi:hypothetical protein